MKRQRVFVQLKNQATNKWFNSKAFPTIEEAEAYMRERQKIAPKAIFRILNNNLASHTY